MNNTEKEIFDKGYTDAYYGKDKSEYYDGLDYLIYVSGQNKFLEEYYKDEENNIE